MAKDPAALVYIDKWIASTNGMPASYRAWYFDLLLYQYDRGEIPDDLDELAGICRVRPSEYDLFKQMVKQVLEQKFKQTESGGYVNEVASEIISKRQSFKKKRAVSGTIGVIVKKAAKIKGFNKKYIGLLKKELFEKSLEELDEYKKEQVLKQVLKLYIDVDVNEDKDIDIDESKNEKKELELPYKTEKFKNAWDEWKEYKRKDHKFKYKSEKSEQAALTKLTNLAKDEKGAIEILNESIANGWKGLFELKNNNGKQDKKPEPDDYKKYKKGKGKRILFT